MMQPYQQTDAYRRSQKLDPVTRQPVWPLRIIENRITPARSHPPLGKRREPRERASGGKAARG